jgi:uncharacterized membrane protein (UPF0127 family)
MGRAFTAVNTTRNTVIAAHVRRAATPWARLVGLMGRSDLPAGKGLHLLPCSSVHTWFMRFTIDVLYLDRDGRVVKAVPALRPFRWSWGGRRAHSVLELPAGTIAASGTLPGDALAFEGWDGSIAAFVGTPGEHEAGVREG